MNFNNRMSRKKKFVKSVFYGSLFLIIFSLGIFPETPEILTISESIELTLKNNQGLFKYANTVLSMKSNLDQKKKNFLPDLNLSGNFSKNYDRIADDSGEYMSNNNRNFNLSLSTNKILFNGFFTVSDKARAFSLYKGSRNNYTRTEQTVIFQTILNYL
ncbi:MAG: TolC family protein, partial [Candidatus Aminicenantes bacterium]|nr:TolC family protein [Candidatus Aminicenantes bacterium]